jgi:hypothetical protein
LGDFATIEGFSGSQEIQTVIDVRILSTMSAIRIAVKDVSREESARTDCG